MKGLFPWRIFFLIVPVFTCLSCAFHAQDVVEPAVAVAVYQPESTVALPVKEMDDDVFSGNATVDHIADKAIDEHLSVSGLGTLEFRQRGYGKRRDQWQDLERQMVTLGFQERPKAWYRCLSEVQSLADQYAALLDGRALAGVFTGEVELFKKDIFYLESGCDDVRAIGKDALGRWAEQFSIESDIVHAGPGQFFQGKITALEMFRELLAGLPEQRLEAGVRRSFALALLRSGRLEAALNLLIESNDKCQLGNDALGLRQLVADLLLATGRVDEARQHYEALEGFFSTLYGVDRWVTDQLTLLRNETTHSGSFALFLNVLRSYLLFDGKIVPVDMEKGVVGLEQAAPGSSLAARGRQLFSMIERQVLTWVESRLEKADELVEKKDFESALEILQELADLQGLGKIPDEMVREALDKVRLAQSLEVETQRMLQEQELSIKWEDGLNLLDLKQFDDAIEVFASLLDTGYQNQAKEKIVEASNMAAKLLRRQASSLFVEARKAIDPDRKKVLLRESLDLLRTIGSRYPETEILEKVRQNLNYLEEYIGRLDPTLLEITGEGAEIAGEADVVGIEEEVLH